MFGFEVDMDISFPKKSIKDAIGMDLYPMDRMVVDVLNISSKIMPVHIYHPSVCDNPYIVIPVKNDVHNREIYPDQIELKVCSWYKICDRKSVL